MAGFIPKQFIEELITRIDLVDVIHVRVPLKKKGREYSACCPFHNEKTPSFTVSQPKQFYYCFGCGVHGSAIDFLMAYEHLSFVETIESLADSLGLDVPREKGYGKSHQEIKRTLDLYALLADVTAYYQNQLSQTIIAVQYLQQRKLSIDIIEKFKIGFAPTGWNNIITQFAPVFSQQQMLDTGLIIQHDTGRVYDRFRERIMFPIRNRQGKVIAFGGRVLDDSTPKYLNSPETVVFHKGFELYGLYEARKHTRKLSRLLVVEGYMDVIALAQYDISYTVASLGTAITENHITQLLRIVPEIIFCFDGDNAGRKAAWRALKRGIKILRDGQEIRFLFLPMGEDPDTYIRKLGKKRFEKQFSTTLSLTDYLLQTLKKCHNISTREGKSRLVETASQHLQQMPDSLIKDQFITALSELVSIDESIIRRRKFTKNFQIATQPQPLQPYTDINNPSLSPDYYSQPVFTNKLVKYACALLLHEPSLVEWVKNPEKMIQFDLEGIDFFVSLVEIFEENPNIHASALIKKFNDSKYEILLANLLKWQPSYHNEKILRREFQDCQQYMQKEAQKKRLEFLLHKNQAGLLSTQEKFDLRDYYKNRRQLNN